MRKASLAFRIAFLIAALTSSFAARALDFHDGDLIIILTKNNVDAMYDFGGSIAPGTTKTFTLPSQFLPGPTGAITAAGANVNALSVPQPGLQEFDPAFGVPLPVFNLRFSTTVSDPQGLLNSHGIHDGDVDITNASLFLQQNTLALGGGSWLPTLPGFSVNAISSTPDSVVVPTSRNGTYSSITGPGGTTPPDRVSGSLPFATSATDGADGSLLLPLFDAHAGDQGGLGGTIPQIVTRDGTLQFSESGGILTVTMVAVPEPGSMVLLGAGVFGLAIGARRRRRA